MKRRQVSGLRFQSNRSPARQPLSVGKKQQLEIERLAHDGRGIAFVDGRTWFVAGALPSEQITAVVLASKGKTVDAKVFSIERASAQRQQPFCQHAQHCGGCTLQHMPQAMQHEFKQQHLFTQLQRAKVQVPELEPMLVAADKGYRRRARLALRVDKAGQLQFGFRALGSQQIVALKECPILVEQLQQLLAELTPILHKLQRPQALGHIELFAGNQQALLVRLNRNLSPEDCQMLREFCAQQQTQLWWQDKAQPYPDQAQQLFYELAQYGVKINYQPGDFVQVNAALNQSMIEVALDWLQPKPNDSLLDLFCGLGNFSLPLAGKVAKLVGVEGVESMVERARQSAKSQGITNAEFYQQDLSANLASADWAKRQYDLLLLDPPRDGAEQLVTQLAPFAARAVLYVSCNPATLARDAAIICQQGYQLRRLLALDMFSQTGHVEAMALFEQVNK